jgi:hypothetical protein
VVRVNAAMRNANIPCLMDILTLMTNIHTKTRLEDLRTQATDVERRLQELPYVKG